MIARLLVPALLVFGLALPAAADTIDVLRKNTLVLTAQDGRTTTILLGEGADLQQVNGAGMWAAGFWQVDEDRGFCWTARGESRVCVPLPADKDVGDSWEIRGPTGQVVWKAEITAGRADLKALSAAPAEH